MEVPIWHLQLVFSMTVMSKTKLTIFPNSQTSSSFRAWHHYPSTYAKKNLEFISYTSDTLFRTSHFQTNTNSSWPPESSHASLPSTITRSVDVTTSLPMPPTQLPASSMSSSSLLPLHEWPTIFCECKSNHIFLLLAITFRKTYTWILHLIWSGLYSAR